MHFFKGTPTSNMRTTTTVTLATQSQRNQFPTRSANQLPSCLESCNWSSHQCVRLLKARYGPVNAPRRWYHRVATDLRNMRCEESLMELCLWIFRDEKGVILAVCLVYVDDLKLACSDSPFGKHVFDSLNHLYRAAHESHKPTTKHTRTWGGFEIGFADFVKEISLISLPSHRRRDRKSQITPLELSQLRAVSCPGWVCNVCNSCWRLCRI